MEKKYIKTFESFRNSRNVEPVNEEFIGGLVGKLFNFLKSVFKKAQDKIKSLTSFDEIKNYYITQLMSDQGDQSFFKGVFSAFEDEKNYPKAKFTDANCNELISKMIDPDDAECVLNDKAIKEFIAGFTDEKQKKQQQYWLETVRNKTLVYFQYGENIAASFVVGKPLKVAPALNIPIDKKTDYVRTPDGKTFKSMKHLPKLKAIIAPLADGPAKKAAALKFAKETVIDQMEKISSEITEEELDKFTGADVEEVGVLGSYGVKEEKELVGKDIYYMMDKYDAKAPNKEYVGKGKVTAFDETKGFSIETDKGTKFDKNADKLLSKVEAEKLLGIKEGETMDYARVKKLYDDKTEVYYLLPGVDKTSYDTKKKPEEQTEIVDRGLMISVDDQNNEKSIKFEKDGKTIERSYDDIVGFVGDKEKSEEAKKTAEKLGRIQKDDAKMGDVNKYLDLIEGGSPDDIKTINDMIKDEVDKLPKK